MIISGIIAVVIGIIIQITALISNLFKIDGYDLSVLIGFLAFFLLTLPGIILFCLGMKKKRQTNGNDIIQENEYKSYCSICQYVYKKNIEFCPHCGSEIAMNIHKGQFIKNIKIILITTIAILLIMSISLLSIGIYVNVNKQEEINYYQSQEFLALNSKDKALAILKREGENNLNGEKDSYALVKEYTIDEFTYNFMFFYISSEDTLGLAYVLSQTTSEFTVSIYLEPNSFNHDLWCKGYNGNDIMCVGNTKLYAPTFAYGVRFTFSTYVGEANQHKTEVLAMANADALISTINNMLKEYNFSMSEFAFYNYK